MPKFVIVDHSLVSLDGHHYEYCISTAESAKKMGYEVIILANILFESELQSNAIKILPIFDVDWFDNSSYSKIKPQNINLSSTISELISYIKASFELRILLLRKTKPDSNYLLLIEKIKGTKVRIKEWLKKDIDSLSNVFNFIPFVRIFWGISKTFFAVISFGIKLFFSFLASILSYSYSYIKDNFLNLFALKSEEEKDLLTPFIKSLSQSLIDLKINAEDHLFIPTIGIEQIEHLLYFLKTIDPIKSPHYHILQRRDVDEPLVQNAQGIGLKGSLYQFYDTGLWPKLVTFYTDTEGLTQQHFELSPVQFITAPIPFRHDKIKLSSEKDYSSEIHVVYLGNARPEKGYQYLPKVVHELWHDYICNGKIRFTIQSNFNLDGGEPGILEARLELEKYPSDKVTLIKSSMDPDNYYELLASADIVLIPYQPDQYRVRSSGVLAEALAAGKPVVVPQKTWLAKQINNDRGIAYNSPEEISQCIISIFENFSHFSENASIYRSFWQEKHSPESLVRCLLQEKFFSTEISPVDASKNSKHGLVLSAQKSYPIILLIFEGDKIFHENKLSSVTIKHIEYLTLCNYQIYAIFYSRYHEYRGRLFEHFKYCVREVLKPFSITKIWFLDVSPRFVIPSEISAMDYIADVEKDKKSLIRDYVELSVFDFSKDLLNTIKSIHIDLIFIDSVHISGLINKLISQSSLSGIPIICDASEIFSYRYALENYCDIDEKELAHEMNLLSRYDVILTRDQKSAAKIIEKTQKKQIYTLFSKNKYGIKNAFENEKKNRKLTYNVAMNNILSTLLGKSALGFNGFEKNKKIAVLYPWNDIHERKSGASRRTGLLIDYLQENSYEVGVFGVDKKQAFWNKKVYYNFYEPSFPHTNLIQEAYIDAFLSWSEYDRLLSDVQNQELHEKVEDKRKFFLKNDVKDELQNSWLPWIYYQFRFDSNFEKWVEDITNWADVVILEYPFWAEIVGKICYQKNVKLVLTAHDVLFHNIPEDSLLRKIALTEEINALRKADAVVTLSKNDQAFFEKYNIKSYCVPIAIDTEKINNICQKRSTLKNLEELEIGHRLNSDFCLFVGSQHNPNIEAVKQIRQWSNLANPISGEFTGKFVIVGGCWEGEEEGNFISLGKVSDKLLSYLYQRATLVLSPLSSGTGMSVKTIEAMAYGKVILGTTVGFRGYPVESGVNCVVCDNLEDYPEKIEQLLQQPEVLDSMGKKAQEFAQDYDYHLLYKTYLDLIL